MSISRREYLQTVASAMVGSAVGLRAEGTPRGIPGPYRGKVVGVTHSKCVHEGQYQEKRIYEMLDRGMCELTGAASPKDAWNQFFQPSDIVGIKVNPVGQPFVCSSAELLHAILDGLKSAGVKSANVIVFERYRGNIENSPYMKWVPEDVRIGYAADAFEGIQQGISGYDPECYVELPFALPGYDVREPRACRSHAALFISRDVNKLINLPVLKTHNLAGVTLALKNLSHGLVNNVSRSHEGRELRYTEFIPAVVNLPAIREKTVLNILDGTRGLFHGGPGVTEALSQFVWEHKTIYLATDPVSLDIVGRGAIDEQRKKQRLLPVRDARADAVWKLARRQPEYIEMAGKAGLGEWDAAKIDFKPVKLG